MHDRIENYYFEKTPKEYFMFFAVFSRFEYAIKMSGMIKKTGKTPYPDWSAFSDLMPNNFFSEVMSNPDMQHYKENPPKILCCNKRNEIFWKRPPEIKNNRDLFRSLKNARNNLFHGDKKNNDPDDNKIIASCLTILNMSYAKSAEGFSNPSLVKFCSKMEWNL